MRFKSVLRKIIIKAVSLGFVIKNFEGNGFYKGDIDGETIWIDFRMTKQEQLFSVLHLVAHSIQWNIDPSLRELGNEIHINPNEETLKKLLDYEWEANCYALYLLHSLNIFTHDEWFQNKYDEDVNYLTHFYKTGEKLKIKPTSIPSRKLVEKEIPEFKVTKNEITRDGIVI